MNSPFAWFTLNPVLITTLWSFGALIVGNDNTTLGRGGIGELHVDDDSLIRALATELDWLEGALARHRLLAR